MQNATCNTHAPTLCTVRVLPTTVCRQLKILDYVKIETSLIKQSQQKHNVIRCGKTPFEGIPAARQ